MPTTPDGSQPARGVRPERSGWRDGDLSIKHRQWGLNVPSCDIDLILEYNNGNPVGLVEFKHVMAKRVEPTHPTIRALTALGTYYSRGALPVFIAMYERLGWWFVVQPLNDPAREFYGERAGVPMTEQQFARSLYALRKRQPTRQEEIEIAKLSTALPPPSQYKPPPSAPPQQRTPAQMFPD